MKSVASNEYYRVEVDDLKNRIYFTILGTWDDPKKIPNWADDVAEAVKCCSAGFTELIDWSGMTAILLTDYIRQAQEIAMKAGLRKAARVYDKERFVKMQMDRLTTQTGFPAKSFFDRAAAEAWLDQE